MGYFGKQRKIRHTGDDGYPVRIWDQKAGK